MTPHALPAAPPHLAGRRALLVAPRAHLADLAGLARAWRAGGARVEERAYDGPPPGAGALREAAEAFDAVLVAGPARYAPATALPGPFLEAAGGRRVPAAWLPVRAGNGVRRFAAAAARVHGRVHARAAGRARARGRQRAEPPAGVAVLGQWHPRYLRVADRVEALLAGRVPTVRWTADVLPREALPGALGAGLALGVYVGHGRPSGWVGYRGVRGGHLVDGRVGADAGAAPGREPLGALVSLCCRTASRRRVGLSYAEAVVALGVAAASVGAVGDTRHTDNTRWAVGLCDALAAAAGAADDPAAEPAPAGLTVSDLTVGDLVVRAAPALAEACASYRIVGDPLAPLAAAPGAAARAAAVPTYP